MMAARRTRSGIALGILALSMLLALPRPASAVIVRDGTGWNNFEPTGALAGSGWQFQGNLGAFSATAIAPRYVLGAKHTGIGVGATYTYQGVNYTTIARFDDPSSDLAIWQVDRDLPTFAPLYSRQDEQGKDLITFGRSSARGAEVLVTVGEPPSQVTQRQGWRWSNVGGGQRSWGTSSASFTLAEYGNEAYTDLIPFAFRSNGRDNAALAAGDSGGGVFIRDGGVWKLAGVNYAVVGPISLTGDPGDPGFNAAMFDMRGTYLPSTGPERWSLVTGEVEVPTYSFATRISTRLDWIQSIAVPEPSAALLAALGLPVAAVWVRRGGRSRVGD